MEGFSFTQNETTVTYCLSGDFAPDNFILTFYTVEGEQEVIIVNHYSGGGSSGGSRIIYKDKEVFVKVPEYINQTINVTEYKEIEQRTSSKLLIWLAICLLVSALIIIFVVLKKRKDKEI